MIDPIVINTDKSILLIDLSYVIFYRYYSTYNWIKKYMAIDIPSSTIMENSIFVEKYTKLFEKCICDIIKTYKINYENVFLVKDCIRETIWRNEHYNEYKITRDIKPDSFNRDIFKYTYNTIISKLIEKYNINIICHDCLEADDIIAIIKNEYRLNNIYNDIIIITNDNDYIQLLDDNTIIKNLQGKEIKDRINIPIELYLKIKIISGDKSDNIPCIMKKIGIKTAEKLAKCEDHFNKFCEKNPIALEQYKLNKLLIDFNEIPVDIKNSFKDRLCIKSN